MIFKSKCCGTEVMWQQSQQSFRCQSCRKFCEVSLHEGNEPVDENTSDGFHTFKELYEHRVRLFIALCRNLANTNKVWCSTKHSDGTMFEDMFILGVGIEPGEQITYHLGARYWSEVCEFAACLPNAPEWDGHTPADVIDRLAKL